MNKKSTYSASHRKHYLKARLQKIKEENVDLSEYLFVRKAVVVEVLLSEYGKTNKTIDLYDWIKEEMKKYA